MQGGFGYLYGAGAAHFIKLKVGASISNIGTIAVADTGGLAEVIPTITTAFTDAWGVSLDTATYSTTQADVTTADRQVTVDARPDSIIRARMSGTSVTGANLVLLSNTAASAGGTVITDADVGTADMTSGTVWCITGANVGHSRLISTHSSGTSFTVTVPFPRAIAVGDEFLFCPYSHLGGAGARDGAGNVQATATDFLDADGAIASGTGGVVAVTELQLNGRADSYVLFVLQDHALLNATL